jgi:hypothetical protein
MCAICHCTDHATDAHYEAAFANYPQTPADLRVAATRICRAYAIRGICDPMYIANVIAVETGRGDGEHHFYESQSATEAADLIRDTGA